MANSVVAALVAKYPSLTGAPPLTSFDEPVVADGVQKYPPYTVLQDEGLQPNYEFEYSVCEVTNILLTVVCATLADVDAAMEIIKYNGGGTSGKLGLDFGTLPALALPYQRLVMMRTFEQRSAYRPTGKDGQRIHYGLLRYQVTLYRY